MFRKEMMVPKRKAVFIQGVVYNEVERFQGVCIHYKDVFYDSLFVDKIEVTSEMAGDPEKYDVSILVDNDVLPLIVKALRRAWRDATRGERVPSLGGLNSARGLRDCLLEARGQGLEGERAISPVLKKIEETERRWNSAIELYRQEIKRRKRRPAPAESVPPQFVIIETEDPFKFKIVFKDKRRSKSQQVKLTDQGLKLYRIVREQLRPEIGEKHELISYIYIGDCLWDHSYCVLVRSLGEEQVHQNIRMAVSRFNRAWFKATGDRARILTPIKKSPGTWAIRPVPIVTLEDRKEKRYGRRPRPTD